MAIVARSRATSRSVGASAREAERAGRVGREDAVEDERMKVHVEIQRAPEALDGGDGAAPTVRDAALTRPAAVEAQESARVDREHGATEPMIPGEQVAQAMREAQHPLPDRDGRQHVVDEMRGALGHAPAAAARADGARLARKRHEALGVAGIAPEPGEAAAPDATREEVAELLFDEGRQTPVVVRPAVRRKVARCARTIP